MVQLTTSEENLGQIRELLSQLDDYNNGISRPDGELVDPEGLAEDIIELVRPILAGDPVTAQIKGYLSARLPQSHLTSGWQPDSD